MRGRMAAARGAHDGSRRRMGRMGGAMRAMRAQPPRHPTMLTFQQHTLCTPSHDSNWGSSSCWLPNCLNHLNHLPGPSACRQLGHVHANHQHDWVWQQLVQQILKILFPSDHATPHMQHHPPASQSQGLSNCEVQVAEEHSSGLGWKHSGPGRTSGAGPVEHKGSSGSGAWTRLQRKT